MQFMSWSMPLINRLISSLSLNWKLLQSPYHVFQRCWLHIQDVQELIRRISGTCRHAFFKALDFHVLNYHTYESKNVLNNLKDPKSRIMGLYGSLTFALDMKSIRMKTFLAFGKWTFEFTNKQWITIYVWSWLPFPFSIIAKNGPTPSPPSAIN